jgi:hypothetical protein
MLQKLISFSDLLEFYIKQKHSDKYVVVLHNVHDWIGDSEFRVETTTEMLKVNFGRLETWGINTDEEKEDSSVTEKPDQDMQDKAEVLGTMFHLILGTRPMDKKRRTVLQRYAKKHGVDEAKDLLNSLSGPLYSEEDKV